MNLSKRYLLSIGLLLSLLLMSCTSGVFTGASLIYDRHNVYIKVSDFQLGATANRVLYQDEVFKCLGCSIEIAVFNRDILLVGQVPTKALQDEAYKRVDAIPGKRRLFNQLELKPADMRQQHEDTVHDSWITTKIRSQVLANSDIDPGRFKVVTYGQIVYLMGDVVPAQATQVITYARQCVGVKRVVKLFKYYNLSDKPAG